MTLINNDVLLPAEVTYKVIKEAIINLEFKPGERLVENKLAESLNFSKAPVREALLKLEGEGLVEKLPFKGCRVIKVSEEDYVHAYEVRATLEALIIEKLCDKITQAEIEELKEIVNQAWQAEEDGDAFRSARLSRAFHIFFLSKEENPYIIKTLSMLDNIIERHRRMNAKRNNFYKDSINQHIQILDLIKQRKANKAAEEMKKHILTAIKTLKIEDY